jgi:RNA polymerase sigma-70 factor (ECF subfamily)
MRETMARELAAHASRMYRVALRIVGSTDAAREVAQDACVKALRRAERFNGRSTLATWLHRITVNCAHDHLRKNCQMDRGRADWDKETAGILSMLEATPAERAERDELYRVALGLVAALPDDCRSAFMLTQLDGYTYDEVAAIEGLPRGTIASRVYRARKILMEQMNHHLAGEIP